MAGSVVGGWSGGRRKEVEGGGGDRRWREEVERDGGKRWREVIGDGGRRGRMSVDLAGELDPEFCGSLAALLPCPFALTG